MIRIIKRDEMNNGKKALVQVFSVLLALLTAAAFISAMGHNPLDVYFSMAQGAFGSEYRISETITKTIPLVITSIGIAVAFKMKFWNIGAEGQIIMGAFAASFVALNFKTLPQPILLILMAAAGALGGGLWAVIPAYFKAYFKTNETIFTLMMNYLALKWITYLQYGPWKDPRALGFPKIPSFSDSAVLPKVFGVHAGWIIAIVLIVIFHIFLKHTKRGYEIAVVGESENTAVYAGMDVKKIIITTMLLSGAVCGLAGMIEAAGVNRTLSVEITKGVGYTAIITTWLSALNIPLMAIISFLFAAMVQGGSHIQMAFQIPQSAALILQGLILFFVLGSDFFIKYRVVFNRKGK